MPRKTNLVDLWFEYKFGRRRRKVVKVEPDPWVCPGWTPMPASKRWSTVFDFIYDPVFSERMAARQKCKNPETMKKWRQRGRGPAYVQYGKNGVVRYPLSAQKAYVNRPYQPSIPDEDPSFDGRDAAVILGVNVATLKKWRQRSRGRASFVLRD